MMVAYTKFQAFVAAVPNGKHDLANDQLVVALCNAANAPVVTNALLADLTQIVYTNLSSRNLVTGSSVQTAGTYKLTIGDRILTASGGAVAPFRYVVIYNDTATNDELIGFYDYGSDLTLADGESLTINFDDAAGVITIT